MLNYVSYMISATLRAIFVRRPDVIIATSPQLFCGWAGVFTGWLRRRPLILEMRDLWAESIFTLTSVKGGRLLRALEWIELLMYRCAPYIVTVGEGYRRQLIERGVEAQRLSIITNGVDREFFAPQERALALERQLEIEGKFVCSYIGTIGLASGLEVVLRAARKLSEHGRDDILFLLVGDGAIRETLEIKCRELQLSNVMLTGRQPKSMIPSYLSISHCCLVHLRKAPLYTTVLPSKIFEAAHMERPIVLGVEGEAAKMLKASGGGICFEPDNEDQLIEAVEQLAGDPELRQRLGTRGHAYVARHFDRDQLAGDYLELIEGICRQATS